MAWGRYFISRGFWILSLPSTVLRQSFDMVRILKASFLTRPSSQLNPWRCIVRSLGFMVSFPQSLLYNYTYILFVHFVSLRLSLSLSLSRQQHKLAFMGGPAPAPSSPGGEGWDAWSKSQIAREGSFPSSSYAQPKGHRSPCTL